MQPESHDVDARAAERELSADLYRVVAVIVVVIGHWLVSAVTFRDGRFGNDYPLAVLPWTQWLTLVFQVVPVFFLVGGYASAAAWARRQDAGDPDRAHWVRRRVGAIVGPTTAYLLLVLAVVGVLGGIGIASSPLDFGGWAVAMHLWFLPVYLVVVTLTPLAAALHRRWGLLVPAALAIVVVGVDAAARAIDVPAVAAANYLFCWLTVYQLGICWHAGILRGKRPVLIGASAAVVLAVVLAAQVYPISMVGAPGATEQNNFPPNTALLLFATAQACLLVVLAPRVTHWLRRSRWPAPLAAVNSRVMALYLWQMIPVVIVALIGYPTGLLPQPEAGTAAWFLFRVGWLVILSVMTAVLLTVVWLARSVTDRVLPSVSVPLPAWTAAPLLFIGIGGATVALAHFAVQGLAAGGRFPFGYALVYAGSVAALCLRPSCARAREQMTED